MPARLERWLAGRLPGRGRGRGGDPMSRLGCTAVPVAARRVGSWPATVAASRCTRPDPGRPGRGRRVPAPADAVAARRAAVDPQPIALPADDAPHDRLTEWWYYTGHLPTRGGRATASSTSCSGPSGAASRSAGRRTWRSRTRPASAFHYAQRSEIGPQVDRSPRLDRRRRRLRPRDPARPAGPADPARPAPAGRGTMRGGGGHDRLTAQPRAGEAAAAGSPGGLGARPDARADQAGGPPRRRRLGRLRAGRRLLLLLADAR